MPPFGEERRLQPRRARDNGGGERGCGDEGIVRRVDQEAGAPDARQVRAAAGARPVVALIGEAVDRRRRQPVVHGERPGPQGGGHVHEAVVEPTLRPDLGPHAPQEASGVERPIEPAVEALGARGQIERSGDGRSGAHLGRGTLAALPEPLEGHVAAQGNADQPQRGRGLPLDQLPDHPVEIRRLARVVEAGPPVQLAAARAEVEHHRPPAQGGRLPQEATGVMGARGPFEPVQDDDEGGIPLEPIQVQEIAVGSGPALAAERRPAEPPEEGPPHGLEVAAPVPPGRLVARLHSPSAPAYSWP